MKQALLCQARARAVCTGQALLLVLRGDSQSSKDAEDNSDPEAGCSDGSKAGKTLILIRGAGRAG